MGVSRVYLAGRSRSKARLETGEKLGADEIIKVEGDDLGDRVSRVKKDGFDKVLITAHPRTISDAVHLTKPGGIISYIGYSHGRNPLITFDADTFHAKHLQLRSYDGPAKFFPKAMNLLERGLVDADEFISHVFTLDSLKDALRTMAEDKTNAIKVSVKIGDMS
jgi:L-iditol 2-dehydrogenase